MVCDLELMTIFKNWTTHFEVAWVYSLNEAVSKNREHNQIGLNEQNLKEIQSTSVESQKVWLSAQPATNDHPYLQKKRVLPHGIGEVDGNNPNIPCRIRGERRYLVIPLYDIFGTIWSVQFISETGQKAFIKGKLAPDTFFCFGESTNKIFIVEGFATGGAFYQYSGQTVYCAFNAYRLSQVGSFLRTFHPYSEIFYIADDDWAKPINTGVLKAKEAAALINAKVFIPNFEGIDRTAQHSDFNDWYLCGGAYGRC